MQRPSVESLAYLSGEAELEGVTEGKLRRRLGKELLRIATRGTPGELEQAEAALVRALSGNVRVARSISPALRRSRRRDLLFQAWNLQLGRMAELNPPADEVRPRLDWIASTLTRLPGVTEAEASGLLKSVVRFAASADRSWTATRGAVLSSVALLSPKVPKAQDQIVDGVLEALGPVEYRVRVAAEITQRDEGEARRIRELLLERSLFSSSSLALQLLTNLSGSQRVEALLRPLSGAAARTEREQAQAAEVVEIMCADSPSRLGEYLPILLLVAATQSRLSRELRDLTVEALGLTSSDGGRLPLVTVISDRIAQAERELRKTIGEHEAQLENTVANLASENARLNVALEVQIRMTENLKAQELKARLVPEHSGKVAVLAPLCSIHQEMLMTLAEHPDQRLVAFSRVIQSLLVRQGVRIYGEVGQAVDFDPTKHEMISGNTLVGASVEIVAPGYTLMVEQIDLQDNLARAVVRPHRREE